MAFFNAARVLGSHCASLYAGMMPEYISFIVGTSFFDARGQAYVLLPFAIPGYLGRKKKANIARAYADLKHLRLAFEDIALDTNCWPDPNNVGEIADQEVWDLNLPTAALVVANNSLPGWNGPYAPSGVVQRDP
jgi:hypothetical protein